MEETAEPVVSAHCALPVLAHDRRIGGWIRRLQLKRPARAVRVHRSAYAFAFGACTGVRSTPAPSDQSTLSKLRVNFASRWRSRNRSRRPRSPSTKRRVAGCWVIQAPSGLAVTPARWTRRVASLMKTSTYNRRSQTVSAVKQVAGHDAGGLLAQERPPGRGCSPWGRVEPVAARRGADRGCRDVHAEPLQLALDAPVAPAWGVSPARRTIHYWTSSSSAGRPGRCGSVHARATSRRCQRRSVVGFTKKHGQRERGSARLTAASRARSAASSLGRGTWRRSTVS